MFTTWAYVLLIIVCQLDQTDVSQNGTAVRIPDAWLTFVPDTSLLSYSSLSDLTRFLFSATPSFRVMFSGSPSLEQWTLVAMGHDPLTNFVRKAYPNDHPLTQKSPF